MTANVPTRARVFLDVQCGSDFLGRLIIELFSDKTPKTCENFRAICISSHAPPSAAGPLAYTNSTFHRIIDEFMIQGGDIPAHDGTGGASIYGGNFEDENIGWRQIDTAGLVCMANRGKDTNSSQFFITLAPCEHLNAKHTVFGHVVKGMDVCERMAKIPVDDKDRPLSEVIVSHCGELERRSKPNAAPQNPTRKQEKGRQQSQEGNARRHRSSNPSIGSRSGARSPPGRRKYRGRSPSPNRRRSDTGLDENRRGRASTRSVSPRDHSSRSPQRHRGHRRRNSPPSRSRSLRRSRSPHLRRGATDRNGSSRYGDGGKPRDWDPNNYDYDPRRIREREEYEISHQRDWRGRPYKNKHGETREFERRIGHDLDAYNSRLGTDEILTYGQRDLDRLGGGGDDEGESGIRFKGRGSMKYRERKW